MKLLIVEDDTKIASFLVKGLTQAGFIVDRAGDGDQGLEMARHGPYAAAIIDIMLPGRDGLALIGALRREGVRLPVLILSARRSLDERVRGLQAGGDDYLSKPFSFAEVLARVRALIRRSDGSPDPTRLSAGRLNLNLLTREASLDGKTIQLQTREFSVLQLLMRNAGSPVSKVMILESVWGFDFDPQTNVVDVLVHRLRRRLENEVRGGGDMIRTLRGVGYVLDAD
ncbi:MAG: response regulator transcription factor [Elusimicrobia bacterium]|nr:response regulator transcription factor [Elusimicrobiota bacterium]